MSNKTMKKTEEKNIGICSKCNSVRYCQNVERGMIQCINFNKFPKEEKQ